MMGDVVGGGQGMAVRDYSEQRFQTEIARSTCYTLIMQQLLSV